MPGHLEEGRDRSRANTGLHGPAILEEALRSAVSERVGATRFALWFGGNVRLGLNREGDSFEVCVPDSFFRDWIERHYKPTLLEAVEAVIGRPIRVSIQIHGESEPPMGDVVEPGPAEPDTEPGRSGSITIPLPGNPKAPLSFPPSPSAPGSPPPSGPHRLARSDRPETLKRTETMSPSGRLLLPASQGRPLRRLEDYVTGPGNRLAHAAAREMAHSAGVAFNPLLIHSGIGLGKTHLLEGINLSLRQLHPRLQIIQLSAEAFTNSFLESMRAGTLSGFRARFRGAGGLIVDDIQFLAAKRATMIEFLYTFNALYDKGAPIILAADQHPRRISRLTDELMTRFLAGMVAKIEPPDMETRQAILKARAIARGIEVPEVVLAYIAEHLRASIRELEGALYTVVAQAVLTGKRLDLNLAQSALRDSIRHTTQSIGLRDVERVVCNLFQMSTEALKSDSRAHALAYPRMMAMYLARKHTGAAYSDIGRHFGGRNHATVISADKKIQRWLRAEKRIALLPGFETVADLLSDLERALGA
jgi:chromosomal replication initiator protein